MAEKEAWPGAGIKFQLENLSKGDVERIERHLSGLASDKARLEWIYGYLHECGSRSLHDVAPLGRIKPELIHAWILKMGLQKRALQMERKLRLELEAGVEAAKTVASKELGQVKSLTAAQRVWVFMLLLKAAGMPEDALHKTEIAGFIVAATGSEPGKVYKHVRNQEQETIQGTYHDLTAVRSWFEKLKMASIVKKIDQERENYEASGT